MSRDGAKPEPAHPLVRLAQWVKAGLLRELNPVERDVLIVYAAFANKKGTAWPAAETIRQLTGHSRTRIFEAIRVLRRLKILEQTGRTTKKGMEEFGAIGPMIYTIIEPPDCLPDAFELSVHAARTAGPIRIPKKRTDSTAGRFHSPHHGKPESTPRDSHSPRDVTPQSTSGESLSPCHEDTKGFEGGNKNKGVKEQGVLEGECEGKPFRGENSLPPVTPLSVSLSSQNEKRKSTAREKEREQIRLFLEAEVKLAGGLKPLTEYLGPRWFAPRYNREIIRQEYEDLNHGQV